MSKLIILYTYNVFFQGQLSFYAFFTFLQQFLNPGVDIWPWRGRRGQGSESLGG